MISRARISFYGSLKLGKGQLSSYRREKKVLLWLQKHVLCGLHCIVEIPKFTLVEILILFNFSPIPSTYLNSLTIRF